MIQRERERERENRREAGQMKGEIKKRWMKSGREGIGVEGEGRGGEDHE